MEFAKLEQPQYCKAGPEFTKASGSEWIVEGYATTDTIDYDNEIVHPEALSGPQPIADKFPILLFMHRFMDRPVGKVLSREVREHGVWVRAEITDSDIWGMIEKGILKAFSLGWTTGIWTIVDQIKNWWQIDLIEISVVNIPSNFDAVFAVAQSKGFDLSRFQQSTERSPHHQTGGTGMDLTLDQVKGVVGDELKAISPTLEVAAKQAAADAVKQNLTAIETVKGDLTKQLAEISKALQGCATKAETEEMQKKTMADLGAIVAENQRLNAKGLPNLHDTSLKPTEITGFEMSVADEMQCSPMQVRSLIHKPEHLTSNPSDQDLIRRYQEASDNIHILDTILSATQGNAYRGPKTLKSWGSYAKLAAEYRKTAGDPLSTGASGIGAEWIPTGFSSQLIDRIETLAIVAGVFPQFQMPTKVYTWPVRGLRGRAYYQPESTVVAIDATSLPSYGPATSNVSFTSKKLAMRCFTSTEEIEDSIIAILPFLQEEIATSLARAIDNAILNGDVTSPAHMDDVTYEGATLASTGTNQVERIWKGLRKNSYGVNVSATSSVAILTYGGAAASAALFLTQWALMKAFAQPPSDVAYICNMKCYQQLLGDAAFYTASIFGQDRNTMRDGRLVSPFGVDIVVSDFCANTCSNVGVRAAGVLNVNEMVNKRAFMLGNRRNVTIKAQEKIEHDQVVVVGTWRGDFQQVIAHTLTAGLPFAVVTGYNIL